MKLNLENSKPQHEANSFLENLFVFLDQSMTLEKRKTENQILTISKTDCWRWKSQTLFFSNISVEKKKLKSIKEDTFILLL